MQRESEDASGNLSIEQYLYRADRYRLTTDSWPLPLPLRRSEPDAATMERFDKLKPAIWEKLDLIMNDQYIYRLCDSWKQSYYQEHHKVTTCLITVVQGPDHSSSWSTIRDEIHSLLQESGLESVEVEIMDRRYAFMPSLFPQRPFTGSVQVYESVRDDLAALLFRHLDSAWVSMSLFQLGSSKDVAIPTIVVFVRPFTECDWQHLELIMNAIVAPKLPEGRNLGIEFLPGKISNDIDHASAPKASMYPGMGASIGVEGTDSSGTMGGFVNLKVGSKIHFGVLTNHHVVAPKTPGQEKPTAAEHEAASKLAIVGYEYSQDIEARPRIMYPSEPDVLDMRKKITGRIENYMNLIRGWEQTQQERAIGGARAIPRIERNRTTYLEMVEKQQKELASLDQWPINMGRVLVSSGNSIGRDRSIIDWAFVETPLALREALRRKARDVNRLPSPLHPSLEKANYTHSYALALSIPGPYSPSASDPNERFYAVNFGAMKKGQLYFKQGRTSAITVGVCNGTETDIVQNGPVRYDEDGKEHSMQGKCARTWLIISMEKDQGSPIPFSKPGDSGSFVIDESGKVCGLLFGEHTGLCGKWENVSSGTVTCMTDVLDSVGRKTAIWNDQGEEIRGRLSLPIPVPEGEEEEEEAEEEEEEKEDAIINENSPLPWA